MRERARIHNLSLGSNLLFLKAAKNFMLHDAICFIGMYVYELFQSMFNHKKKILKKKYDNTSNCEDKRFYK